MSKKVMYNSTHLEGYLYEHDLKMKTTGENSKNPGTDFISGTVSIATDDAMMNVVQVHFTYVTATTAKGKPNPTFNTLQAIIDGKLPAVMEAGKGLRHHYVGKNSRKSLDIDITCEQLQKMAQSTTK